MNQEPTDLIDPLAGDKLSGLLTTRPLELPDDEACWQAAKQIREERPHWVVIWLARTGQFKAYPKFRASSGTAHGRAGAST